MLVIRRATATLGIATLSTTAILAVSPPEVTWDTHLVMAAIIRTIAWRCQAIPQW
jgi:hypothetical protein